MGQMPAKARVYGGATADERAARRRDELIAAAFDLVAEEGWRSLRIDTLCRRAGLNKRYFYESFGDLDGVTAALTQRLAADAIGVTLATIVDGEDSATTIRRAIVAFVEHLTDDPRRARVLFGTVPAGDAAAGHRASAIREVIATVASTGRSLHARIDGALMETTASMLVGGTSQAVLDWLDGRITGSRDRFVEDLVELWLAIDVHAAARSGGA